MTLAAFDLLAPIKADLRGLGRRLDTLTIYTSRGEELRFCKKLKA